MDDGCELLAEAERLHPDVIVLDITLPLLNGIEAARLVFLTVHKDADFAQAAFDAGGLDISLRRGSFPTSWLPSRQRSPIAASSRH